MKINMNLANYKKLTISELAKLNNGNPYKSHALCIQKRNLVESLIITGKIDASLFI